MKYLFWTGFCLLTMLWYIVVTVIIAYRGGIDVKRMLEKLEKESGDFK